MVQDTPWFQLKLARLCQALKVPRIKQIQPEKIGTIRLWKLAGKKFHQEAGTSKTVKLPWIQNNFSRRLNSQTVKLPRTQLNISRRLNSWTVKLPRTHTTSAEDWTLRLWNSQETTSADNGTYGLWNCPGDNFRRRLNIWTVKIFFPFNASWRLTQLHRIELQCCRAATLQRCNAAELRCCSFYRPLQISHTFMNEFC